jgi:hypothetical protein
MSKQLLAKCGVFVLIVVNLGAYYLFWPEISASTVNAEKQENPGKAPPVTATAPAGQSGEPAQPLSMPEEPTQLVSLPPSESAPDGLPAIPDPAAGPLPPPVMVAQAEDPTIEKLKRLKASFSKESTPPAPAPLAPLPVDPPKPPAPVQAQPTDLAPLPQTTTPVPATPKTDPKSMAPSKSPWTLQWEINDGRTTLTAKLHKRVDFRIECDGVKMETQDGALVAVGKVAFSGPSLRGTCDRLTVSLGSDNLVFEGKAELHVQQGNPTDIAVPTAELKGERFALRLQQTAGGVVPTQQALPNLHSDPLVPPVGGTNPTAAPSPFTVPRR